ncbi:MAG: hypothetical protein AAF961_08875 [Planctomycetota bacterium]
MMSLGNFWAVFAFEWRRALTAPRLAWWCVLALFPVLIVSLVRLAAAQAEIPREPWALFLFVLTPMLTSMLGALLWTAPAVSAELERESWIYIAVRPGGRTALLLGKYLAAVAWVLPAALVGLTLSLAIAQTGDNWRLWSAIARITCLSVPAYAAIYLVIGALFSKRAMVYAVAYSLVFELIVSKVPAVINKLTVQYRLVNLWFDWADIKFPEGTEPPFIITNLISDLPAAQHVTVLACYAVIGLALAVIAVRHREYDFGQSGDA